jgi:nicotinate-nucleotide adenylyltransferase
MSKTTSNRAIGIMGGTFDPIHYGHLIIGEEPRRRFGLEKVIFVPAGDPPHKKDYDVSAKEHRYAMTVLATASHPDFECSRMEMDRPGPSYSVDTIRQIKRDYGTDMQVYFITGADAILEILTWHEHDKLKSLCKFIAATRPGYDLDELKHRVPKDYLDQTVFLEVPGVHISSTDLRARIAEGEPIKYMVPESIEAYILKSGLYR